MSRRTKYTDEIADMICQRIADGESLRKICAEPETPPMRTVFDWLADERHAIFRTKYARAREIQADTLFDEMLEIADDSRNDWMQREASENAGWRENGEAIRRADIRIKTRQWMASKLLPKKYGDKIELAGDQNAPLQVVIQKFNPESHE